jgi:hypothetical protein
VRVLLIASTIVATLGRIDEMFMRFADHIIAVQYVENHRPFGGVYTHEIEILAHVQ